MKLIGLYCIYGDPSLYVSQIGEVWKHVTGVLVLLISE